MDDERFRYPSLPKGYFPPRSAYETEHWLKRGSPIWFDPKRVVENTEEAIKADREARTIKSQWLKELIVNSQISVPLLLRHVIIENSSNPEEELNLSSLTFTQGVVIVESEFHFPVSFYLTTFQHSLIFNHSRFLKPVNFGAANAKGNFEIVGCTFPDRTSFEDLSVAKDFRADGAQFGSVSFKRTTFGRCVLFNPAPIGDEWRSAQFHGPADFSDSSMDGPAEFQGACFKQSADFTRLEVKKVLKFNCFPEEQASSVDVPHIRTQVGGKAIFTAARIHDTARFMGAEFTGDVDFERAIISGNALFRHIERTDRFVVTEFHKKARFLMARFQQNAEFDGARFGGEANFERCRVENNAYFRASICVEQRSGKSQKKDGQGAIACPHKPSGVHFEGRAIFTGADISGDAEFTAARFSERAGFGGLRVGGVAYFDATLFGVDTDPVRFENAVTFSGAKIGIQAVFENAVFIGQSDNSQPDSKSNSQLDSKSPIDFSLIQVGGKTDFRRAHFGAKTDFNLAVIAGTVVFVGAEFHKPVSFRDSRFGSLEFGREEGPADSWSRFIIRKLRGESKEKPGAAQNRKPADKNGGSALMPFREGADLNGFSYSLTTPSDGKVLLNALGKSESRQPYFFLERSLRSTGNDDRADEVYLRLRGNERRRIWPEMLQHFRALRLAKGISASLRWLFDNTWRLIASYGVRPLKLLLVSLFMIFVGAAIFCLPGAVVPKEKPRESMPDLTVMRSSADDSLTVKEMAAKPTPSPSSTQLAYTQALGVSFCQFIPIVEIPSGSKWKPSENAIWSSIPEISYAAYGTIHRLAGAFLVPLGIAGLTGLLHRREKSDK